MTIFEMRKFFGSKCKTGMFYWFHSDLYELNAILNNLKGSMKTETWSLITGTHMDSNSYWDDSFRESYTNYRKRYNF